MTSFARPVFDWSAAVTPVPNARLAPTVERSFSVDRRFIDRFSDGFSDIETGVDPYPYLNISNIIIFIKTYHFVFDSPWPIHRGFSELTHSHAGGGFVSATDLAAGKGDSGE
ncbi:MAG: hypothetical protein ACI9PP_000302 [Halobacteriales archaeon]|jgi:hypothetical protein